VCTARGAGGGLDTGYLDSRYEKNEPLFMHRRGEADMKGKKRESRERERYIDDTEFSRC